MQRDTRKDNENIMGIQSFEGTMCDRAFVSATQLKKYVSQGTSPGAYKLWKKDAGKSWRASVDGQ